MGEPATDPALGPPGRPGGQSVPVHWRARGLGGTVAALHTRPWEAAGGGTARVDVPIIRDSPVIPGSASGTQRT